MYGNNFPGMVPWCFPSNHTLITSCSLPLLLKKKLRGCNFRHASDNEVHLNTVLQENAIMASKIVSNNSKNAHRSV
jgi:hypothetical protein